jgi:hypothetical protein
MGLLMSYGDTDPFGSGAVNAIRSFQEMCRYLRAEIAGMLYGSAMEPGDIARNKSLMDEAYQLGMELAGSESEAGAILQSESSFSGLFPWQDPKTS